MQIIVNGEVKQLIMRDHNGIELTRDLLGNYDALNYDQEQGEYTMTPEEFEYWEGIEPLVNEITELESELSAEQYEEYLLEGFSYSELELELQAKLDYLKEILA